MNDPVATFTVSPREADAATLAHALQSSRADTLETFAAFERALPALQVPRWPTLNPPLWELGHVGWFQGHWIERNPDRDAGAAADPDAPRHAADASRADALYDSSQVTQVSRWNLPLPGAAETRARVAAQLRRTLALLEGEGGGGGRGGNDDALYFYRLVLLHEDMHHEAALMMARQLDIAVDDPRWQPSPLAGPRDALHFEGGPWLLGRPDGPGFAFDNELPSHGVALPPCSIDRRVVSWGEFLAFADDAGYRRPELWTAEGRLWLAQAGRTSPRHLRHDGAWLERRGACWTELDLRLPACHLTAHEAEAWCRWAGRRLPGEAEWERAAVAGGAGFAWGDVWEWTASDFVPYPGFVAHPYRDYSAPWFGQRRVLRGASFMTQPRLRDPRYRNFFAPQRDDVAAGFRSCSAQASGDGAAPAATAACG